MLRLFHPSICCADSNKNLHCPCAVQVKGTWRCTSGFRSIALDMYGWYCYETARLFQGLGDGKPKGAYEYEAVVLRPDICKEDLGRLPEFLTVEEKIGLLKQLHWLWLSLLRTNNDLSWIEQTAEVTRLSTDALSLKTQWPLVLIPIEQHSAIRAFTSEVDTLYDESPPLFWPMGPLDFLRSHNVQYVIATLNCDDFCLNEQHGIPIRRMVFKAPAIVGQAFVHFAANYGGCFTPITGDKYPEHWCVLESE